jgi:TonB-linked SusC/RagA family outer membrane protein
MYKNYTKDSGALSWPTNKFFLIMRLTTLILIVTIMQVSASSFAQKITLSEKNAPLSKVFKKISQQSGYDFFVTSSMLKGTKPVTIQVNNADINTVLTTIFKDQPVSFSIDDKVITVHAKPQDENAKPSGNQPPKDIMVHGKVYNEKNEPLIGASIHVQGSSIRSAATNEQGFYLIQYVPEDANLIISYVGYKSDTIAVKAREEINVTLKPNVDALKEIVVVSTGYQTLSKERATGSFGKPDMETFHERSGTNDIVSRLDGLVPGLTVLAGPSHVTANRNGNSAGQQQSIIRGQSSLQLATDPLYVVNGVQVTDFSAINPDDIQDITVLKDAAATAIWGAKAANGVIVVVTKKGNNRKLKFNYSGYFNFQGKPNFDYVYRHELNSGQYIQAAKETFDPVTYPYSGLSTSYVAPHETILYNQYRGLITSGQASASLDSLSKINNQSQLKNLFFRNAYTMNHTVSASGGNNIYNFYSSLSYTDNHSNSPGAANNAYRINLSQDINPNKWLKISLNTSLNNTINSSARPASIGAQFLPYQLFQDANGNNINLNYTQGLTAATRADYQARSRINLDYSPLDEINDGFTKGNNLTINTTADVAVKLWKGLSFEGTYGYQKAPGSTINYDDISEYSQRSELVSYTVAPTTASTPVYYLPTTGGRYITTNNDQRNWTLRNQLIYNTELRSGKDRLSVQLGQEAQEQLTTSNTTIVRGYNTSLNTYQLLDYNTLSNGIFGTVSTGRSVFSEMPFTYYESLTRYTSYFGLLNYALNQKYLIDGSIRADHSNLFGDAESGQKKPSYSLGGKWLISKENFLKDVNWVKDLGLRATYGVAGNSPYLGAGSTVDILRVETNSTTGNALALSTPANNKLSWESTRTYNLGIDFSLLNYRLSGSVDLYQKNTTDLIGSVPLNPLTGSTSTTGNLGNLRNKGIEISLHSINLQSENFNWSTNFVFSYNNNKLLSYTNPSAITLTDTYRLGTSYVVGYGTPSLFAYKFAGLDNLGDPQIQLANGTITKKPNAATANDLVYMGTTLPVFNGGLTNTFRYQRISLAANMIYSLGAVMRRDVNTFYTGRLTGGGGFTGNISSDFANRWKTPGDEAITNIPSYVANQGTSFSRRNVLYYEDADINVVSASYIKLRDITLSYNLSPKILQVLKIESLNLFVQTGNFMIWKANKYDIDPEYNSATTGTRALPPYGHTYSVGLNASF